MKPSEPQSPEAGGGNEVGEGRGSRWYTVRKSPGEVVKTERVSGGSRQVVSHPCRGPGLQSQQWWIQTMMTAMDARGPAPPQGHSSSSAPQRESWPESALRRLKCRCVASPLLYSSVLHRGEGARGEGGREMVRQTVTTFILAPPDICGLSLVVTEDFLWSCPETASLPSSNS